MSARSSAALFVLLILGHIEPLAAQSYGYTGWQQGPWAARKSEDGLRVYTNDKPPRGTDVDAVRVDVELEAPIEALLALVLDHDRAAKFSFVREYKVLKQEGQEAWVYQRVKESGLDDRDFTVHLTLIAPSEANGQSRGCQWRQDNARGPKERAGVVRATMVQGSYVLTPLGAGRTRLSYRLLFDPNTWVPDFVLRRAVRGAAVETVKTLRRDAKQRGLLR